MPLIALLLLSSFAYSQDFRVSTSIGDTEEGKEIIVKADRILSGSDRLRVYEYVEVLAYDVCGGKVLYPELQLQEALPSEEAFSSVRRVIRCEKLSRQSANWFKTFVKGVCKKENLFQDMEKVCLKYNGK